MDAEMAKGMNSPVAVGVTFINALYHDRGRPNLYVLQQLVTPESVPAWGDFRSTAERLKGCGAGSMASPSMDDPDVVYFKFITDHDGVTYQAQEDMIIMTRAVATLVRRPSLGGWRIHGVGEPLRPETVPHD
jgi:hypothetical protein